MTQHHPQRLRVGFCSTVEGEGMRLFLIVCLAVPLVVCAAVCDAVELVVRRVASEPLD